MLFLSFCFSILFQIDPIKIGANQFGCPYCPKIMNSSSKINRHIVVHTGIKPFSCPYCPRGFTQKNDVDRHIRRLHPELQIANKNFWLKQRNYDKHECASLRPTTIWNCRQKNQNKAGKAVDSLESSLSNRYWAKWRPTCLL